MLTIYGRRTSMNVQKVMWLVGEMKLPHERIDLGREFGGLDTPEFLAMNPHGRIPVIRDEKATVWESHAILRYLAARHPEGGFWSDDPVARSLVDRWMDWSLASLQPPLVDIFWGYWKADEDKRDWPAIRKAMEKAATAFLALDRSLAIRTHVAGDRLSLADMTAGVVAQRYLNMDFERPELPHVAAWLGRLAMRPAFAEHVVMPF